VDKLFASVNSFLCHVFEHVITPSFTEQKRESIGVYYYSAFGFV